MRLWQGKPQVETSGQRSPLFGVVRVQAGINTYAYLAVLLGTVEEDSEERPWLRRRE